MREARKRQARMFFGLEKRENGKSEKSNGKLEFSLENGYLENGVGN